MRYIISLARTLHRPIFEVAARPEREILLQMAYDRAQNPDFQAACEKERERARWESLSQQERDKKTVEWFKQIAEKEE
ncbi:hypothetical protein [Leptospira interrogans]|uniref:hypothetical protein n=1 Tax=Leptospira interrogans TaxID=173 RepID=UPI00188DB372|nr:hypothetical protein [Leptospira interrogans]MBF3371985.1 hypothetical protein [Leptospira interrogans serovar Pomona]